MRDINAPVTVTIAGVEHKGILVYHDDSHFNKHGGEWTRVNLTIVELTNGEIVAVEPDKVTVNPIKPGDKLLCYGWDRMRPGKMPVVEVIKITEKLVLVQDENGKQKRVNPNALSWVYKKSNNNDTAS